MHRSRVIGASRGPLVSVTSGAASDVQNSFSAAKRATAKVSGPYQFSFLF
ncbi:hypothetical protein O3P69_018167 [Scylla paramamosain]